MGFSAEKINFVGKIFTDREETLDYLFSKNIINQQELSDYKKEVEETNNALENFLDFSHIPNFPEFLELNYSDVGNSMLMYRIQTDVREGVDPESYKMSVIKAKENWKKIFGDEVEEDTVTQYG